MSRTIGPFNRIKLLGLGCLMGDPTCLELYFFTLYYVSNYLYGEVCVEDCRPFELNTTLGVGLPNGEPLPMILIFVCIIFLYFLVCKGGFWRGLPA